MCAIDTSDTIDTTNTIQITQRRAIQGNPRDKDAPPHTIKTLAWYGTSPHIVATCNERLAALQASQHPDTWIWGWELHQELEWMGVIRHFIQYVKKKIPLTGVRFWNHAHGWQWESGPLAPERMGYRLHMNTQCLGQWLFMRKTPFEPAELAALESYLEWLVLPLRNAAVLAMAQGSAGCDPETGVGNRHAWDTDLARALAWAQRHQRALTMLLIQITPERGLCFDQPVVDPVRIHQVAQAICLHQRQTDQVYYLEPGIFGILLPETEPAGAVQLAQRIRHDLGSRAPSAVAGSGGVSIEWIPVYADPGADPADFYDQGRARLRSHMADRYHQPWQAGHPAWST